MSKIWLYRLIPSCSSKGHVTPSTTDAGTDGSLIMGLLGGMDLHPNVWGLNVKMFTRATTVLASSNYLASPFC
jgi:hypothetical protein